MRAFDRSVPVRILTLGLVLLGSASAPQAGSAPALGAIEGVVRVGGQPSSGLDLSFVDVRTGAVRRSRSGSGGLFNVRVEPGDYVVAAESNAGLGIERAPGLLSVQVGRTARVEIDLVPLAGAQLGQGGGPDQMGGAGGATITHQPVSCFVDDYCPIVTARIEPAEETARARVVFRGSRNPEWYYVEMRPTKEGFAGRLPRAEPEAGAVHYYISTVGQAGQIQQTPEVTAPVVKETRECPQGVAPSGSGEVAVYTAATGSRVMPPDFDDCGGKLPLLLGAAGAGILTGILVFGGDEAPAPATPFR